VLYDDQKELDDEQIIDDILDDEKDQMIDDSLKAFIEAASS